MSDAHDELPTWEGEVYAANTAHHRVHDDRFLAPLGLRGDERVLDLGCGSGDFTAKVAELVPDGVVVGIDPQPSLLEVARSVARPNQVFLQGAAQDLAAVLAAAAADADQDRAARMAAPFDVVISRATLHWVPAEDQLTVLRGAFAALAPGGRLRVEMGGAGNIGPTMAVLDQISTELGGPTRPWQFSDPGSYLEWLDRAGFETDDGAVLSVAQRRAFDRDSLIGWFVSQVTMAYEHRMEPHAAARFRELAIARIDDLRYVDGSYDQLYVRLEALARRPLARHPEAVRQ
jgi:trans-aconitate 2-methyltransferase